MKTRKTLAVRIAPYQHDSPGRGFRLAAIDPGAKPLSSGHRQRDKDTVVALAEKLDALQMLFYADRRYKLLVVLQGMDTSGKDGTLRDVFGHMSPLGVRAVGWKAPNEEERSHDPWWRIHRAVPGAGEIIVFNRSHYEDVLVPVVNGQLSARQIEQRYRQINEFERMLTEHDTVICKFMLHISKDEQRERLQARLDDTSKHWKFDASDLEVRKRWDDYMAAYDAAIRATGTAWAPWTVVPADSKTHRNLMIATVLEQRLRQLKLRPSPSAQALGRVRIT
jgi:PPK2 family polyphosphate:nucleotide phosphotransferase